ncbi:MAG: ABC transporter permease [Myxococcales bacterium]|nr:ABC transporter permease [Myxococcales bacterium]MBL9108669.1 ABC transporter permease [Myxococcales bacterium]
MSSLTVMVRLELADALRSRWALFTAGVYALVFGMFVWLGLRESSVLGFTGLSRVVLNMANAVVLAVPLVALVATCQTVVRARQSGFFELMMSQPLRRSDWFYGAVVSRFVVVAGPLVLLLVGALVVGAIASPRDTALVSVVLRSLAVTAALSWAFIGLGFLVSTRARTPERATVAALLVWLMASALHDFALIGLLLRVRLSPQVVFALAAANPVEAARIAILGAIDPELSVLGPVGFWLAHSLGPTLSVVVGVAWPLCLGTAALVRAERTLSRSDLVG